MKQDQKISERRMGPPGSKNWHAMLDGAEAILREEGHAALTSRNVAERIGVKQRLVYYYFRTMDELVVETFRRLSAREFARLERAAATDRPLREIWDVFINTEDARLTSEFMALAARIDGLEREVIHFIERSREIQCNAIRRAADETNETGIAPEALAFIATSIALALTREHQLGVHAGHAQIRALIENMLQLLEPSP